MEEGGTPPSHPETKKGMIKRVDRLIVSELPSLSSIHETNQKSFLLSKGKKERERKGEGGEVRKRKRVDRLIVAEIFLL
jgi:hypothetical protein